MDRIENDSFDVSQMRLLADKLTPDERAQITEALRSCSMEMIVRRGIPLTFFLVGSLYLLRDKLPHNLRFGPQRWVFNGFLAVGCVTLSNILFQNTCVDRIRPKMLEFHRKYNLQGGSQSASATRYDQLRNANRHQQSMPNYNQSIVTQPSDSNSQEIEVQQPETQQKVAPQTPSVYQDTKSYYMSGTPVRSEAEYTEPVFKEDKPRNKNNTYGDEGFS